ncbi:hypothetical protein BTO04_09570 [Polaribacter sp. SA4-10]|uniref:hypothetical protein n=1 Tax=Polaribacter sp. SA4-10 TaxID=754397 RepID=UPI000B3CC8EF|nr:hypothetical protein [Polaribacter sp. SA4-10]ARV06916.1 hypothetical protein BTO04_09570 [Polaribacter sp. SA4-10]
MNTKTIILSITLFTFLVKSTSSQTDPNFEFKNAVREEIGAVKKLKKFDNEDLRKTIHVRFLHQDYKKAYISNSKQVYLLRYNIFTDEMEYVKNNNIYTLNKSEHKIIDFFEIKAKYGIFYLDNELNYFLIKNSGKNSVLIKQIVQFDEGKKVVTQFDTKIAPKFFRKNDQLFIAFNNKELKSIPKRKKAFYKLFNNKAALIKKYMSEQKLSHKNIDDIVKITTYFNSL